MSSPGRLERWSRPPEHPESRPRYLLRKVVRHVHWARTEGLGAIIEEDQLDPRERLRTAWAKARWRRRHGVRPGTAVPVHVVGLQRSGTNMLLRGIDRAPEVEVRGENDTDLFERYRLRGPDQLRAVVTASRHRYVVVKPLCDSHRVADLLDLPGVPAGHALWVYRDAADRARSEVAKFGDANLRALRTIAAGKGGTIWQGRALPPERVDMVRSFDLDDLDPHDAAALFWVLRNELFFDLGLDRRDDVHLVSYDAFVADPTGVMELVCERIGFRYRPELCAHVQPRDRHARPSADLDPRVADLVQATAARLEAHRRQQAVPPPPTHRE